MKLPFTEIGWPAGGLGQGCGKLVFGLDRLSLRCLLDIQVEMLSGQLDNEFSRDTWVRGINLKVTC